MRHLLTIVAMLSLSVSAYAADPATSPTRAVSAPTTAPTRSGNVAGPAVSQTREGALTYTSDPDGNRVPDFSSAGYMGGDSDIPNGKIAIVVPHAVGDNTARLQAAIDQAASIKSDDSAGPKVVLLAPGRFEVSRALKIGSSNVVLRGSGVDKTTLVATGLDRRTLIEIAGNAETQVIAAFPIQSDKVPVNARTLQLAANHALKPGNRVRITRVSSPEWIKSIGMDNMGGERHGFSWKPGSRNIVWDRVVSGVDGANITLDAPLTTLIDKSAGGGSVAHYESPGRINGCGVENLSCESTFDKNNPKDENHSWIAISINAAQDCWVRQVNFRHFASSAVAVFESGSRITVEDCKSTEPVSEIGGSRRRTFYSAGQQVLFQRCFSDSGIHDFSVGFCSAGPNVFLECEARNALGDTGPLDSWASGLLYDNVKVDGNKLTFNNRYFEQQGAGWCAANSVMWNCSAAVIECFAPPGAQNWAFGTWGQFAGNGVFSGTNDGISPESLYKAQSTDRLGAEAAKRVPLLAPNTAESSSPSVEQAQRIIEALRNPPPTMPVWIDQAPQRTPIPTGPAGAKTLEEPKTPVTTTGNPAGQITIDNGWVVRDGKLITGTRGGVQWWRGTVRPDADPGNSSLTRFVPGRSGLGLTDDLQELTDNMAARGRVMIEHHYGLWYDRRRDDHQRIRRMDGNVQAPFFEQPFARSGQGIAWDGLSKYDLTQYNPWYFSRLREFSDLGEAKGLLLIYEHFFQHNILEAGAHWADCPWRTANNINNTGFPEPPPYAGDKRIFVADYFYDVKHPVREPIYRAYIRKCLENFRGNSNVIHLTSEEFTGPLHFAQYWVDVCAQFKQETGDRPIIGLSATKDVQDDILGDTKRLAQIDLIDIRYWWYQPDGTVYAPPGGINLAPRQHDRVWKPKGTNPEQIYRAVREYRSKFPQKAVLYSGNGASGWAVLMGGGSIPPLSVKLGDDLLKAIPKMKPLDSADDLWMLGDGTTQFLAYRAGGPTVSVDLTNLQGEFTARWIDASSGKVYASETIAGNARRTLPAKDHSPVIVWLSRKTENP